MIRRRKIYIAIFKSKERYIQYTMTKSPPNEEKWFLAGHKGYMFMNYPKVSWDLV